MTGTIKLSLPLAALLVLVTTSWAQESDVETTEEAEPTTVEKVTETLEEQVPQALEEAREKADAVAEAVDKNDRAQEVSAGILKPIYRLAEAFSFPMFHWAAFAVMVAGVVSFALQLTIGKLVVLSRFGFSLAEILSDALGLVVSVVGLVLTTQAAAENSNFTTSAAAVLSATIVGGFAGFIFYMWGQKHELEAVEGRRTAAKSKK